MAQRDHHDSGQLVLEPTATAQWQALVSDAETASCRHLDETLESYLVFLLMRFATHAEFSSAVMSLQYLRSQSAMGQQRTDQLRDVGDQCLLVSGLFPGRAERRLVSVGYFVALGQTAYHELAQNLRRGGAAMYAQVAAGFLPLMEVLQAMRGLNQVSLQELLIKDDVVATARKPGPLSPENGLLLAQHKTDTH